MNVTGSYRVRSFGSISQKILYIFHQILQYCLYFNIWYRIYSVKTLQFIRVHNLWEWGLPLKMCLLLLNCIAKQMIYSGNLFYNLYTVVSLKYQLIDAKHHSSVVILWRSAHQNPILLLYILLKFVCPSCVFLIVPISVSISWMYASMDLRKSLIQQLSVR